MYFLIIDISWHFQCAYVFLHQSPMNKREISSLSQKCVFHWYCAETCSIDNARIQTRTAKANAMTEIDWLINGGRDISNWFAVLIRSCLRFDGVVFLLLDLARSLLIYWIIFYLLRAQKMLTPLAWT